MSYLDELLLLLSAVELKYRVEKEEQCLVVRENLLKQIETVKKCSCSMDYEFNNEEI